MASDKLGTIQKPLLNLDLDISEDGSRRVESIELNKQELERLITSLEAANKVCMYIHVHVHTYVHVYTCII